MEAARHDTYVEVPSPAGPHYGLGAMLEAMRDGRPFSHLPHDHAVALLRPPPPLRTEPLDPTSPGGRLPQILDDMARKAAEDPNEADLWKQLEQARRDTIKAIEAQNRERDRRERMRARRARRKANKAARLDAQPPFRRGGQ